MSCREVRRTLCSGTGRRSGVSEHLATCPDCRELSDRWQAIEGELAAPVHAVVPGPEFAARVVAALPGSTEVLGWAALRLLPGAVALALLLSWLSLTAAGSRELVFDPVDEAVLMTYPAGAPR